MFGHNSKSWGFWGPEAGIKGILQVLDRSGNYTCHKCGSMNVPEMVYREILCITIEFYSKIFVVECGSLGVNR